MNIQIVSKVNAPRVLAKNFEDKLRYSLRRFSNKIQSIYASLTDVNASKGGVDKQVFVSIKLTNGQILRQKVIELHWGQSIHNVSQKVQFLLQKKAGRKKTKREYFRNAPVLAYDEF
jgi:hypothetical protein